MAAPKIRKAVFPVGGLGTRFLPATKSMPKEMLPVVDKPIIHYAFEEARDAGIEQFIFVTGRNKNAISDHFDHSYELQDILQDKQKTRELEIASGWLPQAGTISYTRQQEPLGLGHAVWCARHLVGNEPFAVILADDMVLAKTPVLKQMVNVYPGEGNILGVCEIPRSQTHQYGIVDIDRSAKTHDAHMVKAKALVEKPKSEDAPSTLSIIGRYILQPEIFSVLETQKPGSGKEIQLTDAINRLIATQPVYGYEFEGTRYDCGGLAGFVSANVAYALQRGDVGPELREQLAKLLK